jgi:uncharacterized protein YndB with AHSA1/START domain
MKTPQPTGRLDGNDLIITRTFRAPIDDVWTSVTSSESTARWFGPWEGTPGTGSKIRVQMGFEKDSPWMDNVTIEKCEAPRHLHLISRSSWGTTDMELTLSEAAGTTTLRFVHHLTDRKGAGDYGPGWEYYLDNLVAMREGRPLPKFEDYHPGQKPYFEALL